MPWLCSSGNKVQTNVFCCCLIVNYGVALHRTCYTIVCIVQWCPVVYKTSTASIQSIGFTVPGIPFALVNFWFLSLVTCGFEMWGSGWSCLIIHNVAVETKPFLGVSCARSTFLKWLSDEGKDIFRWYDEKKHECSVSHVFLCVIALPLSGAFEGHKLKLAWGFLGVNFWSRDSFGFCWKP